MEINNSGHILSKYEELIRDSSSHSISELRGLKDHTTVKIGGIIKQVDLRTSRKTGNKFAFCQLEDLTGVVEITAWDNEVKEFGHLLQPGKIIIVEGTVTARDRGSNVKIIKVYPPGFDCNLN